MPATKRQQDIDAIIGMLHRVGAAEYRWVKSGEYGIKRRVIVALTRAVIAVFIWWITLTMADSPDKARLLQAMRDF